MIQGETILSVIYVHIFLERRERDLYRRVSK